MKPEYFTENMNFERNPHDDLAPTMSALIIIAHVKEGVDLALKHNLNRRIIDIIQQHHGTSLVYYFYKRALQQQEDARAGGKIMNMREEDVPEVREESFRYPGPKPQTKESAIISLADMVESASRSLEKPTPQKIEQLVTDFIAQRIADGQLDECDLTLAELRIIAERFRFTLMTMLHTRIAYPKQETKTTAIRDDELAARRDGGNEEARDRASGFGGVTRVAVPRSERLQAWGAETAIVLGSGLSSLVDERRGRAVDLRTLSSPILPRPTVAGHAGRFRSRRSRRHARHLCAGTRASLRGPFRARCHRRHSSPRGRAASSASS